MKLRIFAAFAVVMTMFISSLVCLSGTTEARTVNTAIFTANINTQTENENKVKSDLLTEAGQTVIVNNTGNNLTLGIQFESTAAVDGTLDIITNDALEITVIGNEDDSSDCPLEVGITTIELNCRRLEPEQQVESEPQPDQQYGNEHQTEQEPENETPPGSDVETQPEQETDGDVQTDQETETGEQAEQENVNEPQQEPDSEIQSEEETESDTQSDEENESEIQQEPEGETQSDQENEVETQPEQENEIQQDQENESESQPEQQSTADLSFTVTWTENTEDEQHQTLTAVFVLKGSGESEDPSSGSIACEYGWFCHNIPITLTTDAPEIIKYSNSLSDPPGDFPPFTEYEINGHVTVLYDGGYVKTDEPTTVSIDLSKTGVSNPDQQDEGQNQIFISSAGTTLTLQEAKAPQFAEITYPLVLTDGDGTVILDKYLLESIEPAVRIERLTKDEHNDLTWEETELVLLQVQDDDSVLLTAVNSPAGTYRIEFSWEENGLQLFSLNTVFYVRHQRAGQGGISR